MDNVKERVNALFTDNRVGVLATIGDEYPLASVMFYAMDSVPTELILGCRRDSTKFENISEWPSVTFVLDRRAQAMENLEKGECVTAFGRALALVPGDPGFDESRTAYLLRNPELDEFSRADDFAIIRVHVERFEYVRGVDEVSWLDGPELNEKNE